MVKELNIGKLYQLKCGFTGDCWVVLPEDKYLELYRMWTACYPVPQAVIHNKCYEMRETHKSHFGYVCDNDILCLLDFKTIVQTSPRKDIKDDIFYLCKILTCRGDVGWICYENNPFTEVLVEVTS